VSRKIENSLRLRNKREKEIGDGYKKKQKGNGTKRK